ncbi:hypothetical protein GCM10022216_14610 [Sphingobacterium kyonggiense]|uniref:Uncharacterized protein n=1 Tax=Sphingobacterium kyonggiense TaxID=714075 RepID=A0ABP7YLI9_9SPHI
MFLKLFEPIFNALGKNTKLALLAMLLAVLIGWGSMAEVRIQTERNNCIDERRLDKDALKSKDSIIAAKDLELDKVRNRLFEYFMRDKETQTNDSILRKSTNKDINKVMP